ncbi:MAG: carboxypeptidase regulatory-like domain-containing protein, partial [Acidobacteriales bacterium]|nr:carboxypeptidase regulatory-like domain-containing protein [Terriglobales bacterium]
MSLLGCRLSPGIVFLLRLLLLLLVALAFGSSSLAQNSRGSVRGTVFDASGARVRTAQISLTMPSTSQTRRVALNERGDFRVDDLTPGNYIVLAQAKGFGDVSLSFPVLVNFVQQLSIILKPQPVEESVNVRGVPVSVTSQPIDSATAIHQSVVTDYDLQSLPLAHRSFANIAYLTPGTEPVEPSDPTKARITAVSFGGSSGLNVQNTVDGGDNTDDYIGGFLQNFSADAIQEFAVQTAQEEAETGQTVGGSVVISTKHGSNDWHGGAAFYERASALTARYPLDNPSPDSKQPFSRQNYVGTLGGPIKTDKVWFFSSFEYVHEDASISYSPTSLTEFNALASLAADGLIPGVPSISVPNNVPVPFRDFLGTARLDLAQSPHSQWFLRGALDNYTTENDLVQQATLASTGATSGSKYFNVALNNVYSFSPTWLGSFTADFGALHHTEARNQDYG